MVSEELSSCPGGVLPILVGPTASGKTALALALAEVIPVEIVSCDSVQVYRGFDVGSSKATHEERGRVVHHLLDLVGANEEFNAGMWAREADRVIAGIRTAGRVPLIVGGTGLYLRALLHGLAPTPNVPAEVREALELRWEKEGGPALHAELLVIDPMLGERLPPGDRQRILRALAVHEATGTRLSELQEAHRFSTQRYDPLLLGVSHDRDALNERINARVVEMLDAGWVAEVEALLGEGARPDSRPMQATGYRQLVAMLARGGSADEVLGEIQQAHRRYAKRQMTWFRSLEITWMDPGDVGAVARRIQEALESA